MKHILLFTVLLLGAVKSQAQIVDGINIWKDSTIQFIQIVGGTPLLSKKVIINVDYGQKLDWGSDTRVEDANGKIVKFNSMIDALNYFSSVGWEFVNAYAITVGNSNVYHYLLKRGKG